MTVDRSNKPILRLKNGKADFDSEDMPPEFKKEIMLKLHIAEWKQDSFDIKVIGEDEKYLDHYKARVDALNEGIQHLLNKDFFPQYDYADNLKVYLNQVATECKYYMEKLADGQEISVYQNSLANYTSFILQTLQTELHLSDKEAMHVWSRAEQFALAKNKTKQAVCTIVKSSDNDYMAMIDQPENPFDEEIKDQLKQIQSTDVNNKSLPLWFSELSDNEKKFIKNFLKDVDLDKNLGSTINALSSKLRTIPVPSNYGTHSFITHFENEKKEIKTKVHTDIHRSSHTASRDVVKKSQTVRDTHTERNIEKEIMDGLKKARGDLEDKINKLYEKGELSNFYPKVKIDKKNKKRYIVVPILYQTLISPTREPDASLNKDRERAIKKFKKKLKERIKEEGGDKCHGIEIRYKITATNHPLNYAKYVDPTTAVSKSGIRINQLLNRVKRFPNPFLSEHDKALLKDACKELKKISHTFAPNTLFNSYRELYLSSLEQIVVELQGGISLGSCVSGKDRKAIELAHTDAMKHYFNKYGFLPQMHDPDPNFSKLFAEIYCSKHQQTLAAQNAPGAFGTKTPNMYLPDHLIKAVNEWYANQANQQHYENTAGKDILKESDRLASNNDIKYIKKIDVPTAKMGQVWQAPTLNREAIYFPNKENKPDEKAMQNLIDKAVEAIKKYKGDGDSNEKTRLKNRGLFGLFSRSFDPNREKFRAETYINLFNSDHLKIDKKLFLLSALLLSDDGKNLQNSVYPALGFTSLDSARHAFDTHMRAYAKTENLNFDRTLRDLCDKINGIRSADKQSSSEDNIFNQLQGIGSHVSILNRNSKS